ncbi:ABC transporter permease [Spiroplasma sp. NBRC 100390]|uniref:ABC transporter permease n=1 Tax=unclassified Spiroplasma TaxID=2637901 RepID=UPI000892A1D1|nr:MULTISPECIES: ABC transporter permease [unclassified Spiroplasma]AOX43695.1 ABC transporter permease [Spiroplasma sp. TU-14]APE13165.1 ABC transporter permease [Spiroplasma sp. NBRC 100390]
MTHNEATKTTSIKKKSDLKKKISSFFSIKMLRYTLIKMLKSPSTYVMFVLTFAVGLIITISMSTSMMDNPSGEYSEIAKSTFNIYAWIWYMLYFGLTSMFIGFKAVQLVRDEIDDGTLLIFSSIPISRTRMIIEKWLALQFLCLIYSVIILLVPPLISLGMGPKGLALGKAILSKVNFMILTSFILQLFLTTIGILISLGLNAKGVIGILFTIGFLTVIGAMIPFIYNSTKLSDKSSAYLMKTTDLAKSPVKFNDSELIKTYHNMLDPVGWPTWNYYNNKLLLNINSNLDSQTVGSFNVTSLANNINAAIQSAIATAGTPTINWEQFVAEVKKNPTNYPNLAKLINNYVLEFDGYNPKSFTETEIGIDKVQFFNNTDKGINILGQFYQELASGNPLIVSSTKPSSAKINLNELDESKLTTNTSKQIYKIMKTMYDKGVFSPTIIGYDNKYSFGRYGDLLSPNVIAGSINENLSADSHKHFNDFRDNLINFLTNNLYLQNVYLDDPVMSIYYQFVSQMYYWLNQGAYSRSSDSSIFDDNTKATSELQSITNAQTEYKLMAYLNIWQQWVIMWTGDARASLTGQDNIVSSMLLPLNNYLEAKVNNVEYKVNSNATQKGYFLMADFNKPVTLTSLTGMYAGYLLVTGGLAAITLWWITRKDFV